MLFASSDVIRCDAVKSFASIDSPNLVLDTIKKAEDSDAIVLRFYECHGARGSAKLTLGFPVKGAALCNILEEEQSDLKLRGDGEIELNYMPYQIISMIVR